MNLAQALRLPPDACLALVGAGGKTTALFRLARELAPPIIVSATTHMALAQTDLADHHLIATHPGDISALETEIPAGVSLVTGPVEGERTRGVDRNLIEWLHAICRSRSIPLLIEADGSRRHPLKAPAAHEPALPGFVKMVVVVAGLSGLGRPLTSEHVHRPRLFARLGQARQGECITLEMLARVLAHPEGGLKNIPAGARRAVLLNQADTPELQAQAKTIAERLFPPYHAVISASLEAQAVIHAVIEPVAGILLAAGESRRFGLPKQLLRYHNRPFVRVVAETALAAGLAPLVVVTGAHGEEVAGGVAGLPVTVVHNPDWQAGQSTSIRAGLKALPAETGAAVFLLSDQPQVPVPILRALVERHAVNLPPIVAPLVSGRRANPVLFDRVTFPELMALTGDTGGRVLFSKYPVTHLPWHEEGLLLDVDTPGDYEKLNSSDRNGL